MKRHGEERVYRMNNNGEEYLISKGYSYFTFSLLFLVYMFNYIDRLVVVSFFPFLKRDWGLSDAECGMLVSTVYWSIIAFSIPASVIVDRWSRRKSISIMVLLWSMATGLCAFTKNFVQLFSLRSLVGIGEAGFAPGGTALISALFPLKKRAMAMGIWNASIPLGSAFGMVLGGVMAEHFGWRYAFAIAALPGFIIGLLFLKIKDYKTVDLVKTRPDGQEKIRMKYRDIMHEFIGTPSLILTYFAFAGNTFVTTALLSWLPTYFYRIEHLSMDKASMKASLVLLLAIIGSPLGGFIADTWIKKRSNARLVFSSLSSLITALVLFIAFYFLKGKVQYMVLLVGGVSATAFVPAAAAVTQDVVHAGLRAVSYSLCAIVQNLLGSSTGPVVVGMLSDRYGIHAALTVVPLFALIASFLYFVGSFFYDADMAKVEKIKLGVEE